MRRMFRAVLVLVFAISAAATAAEVDAEMARLLAAAQAPPGVVFEVVSGDEAELDRVLPRIRAHAGRLRERFPGLAVAVLTHGSEQFSLLSGNAGRYRELHQLVSAVGEQDRIAVEVCGNHASFRDKGRADFPDYVDVVSSASARLSEYREAGFVIIEM